jgi:hypothetical protein
MKHLLLILLLVLPHLALSGYGQTGIPAQSQAKPKSTKQTSAPKVYICHGGSAYAYHSSNSCAGLNRCTHEITAVTKGQAEGEYKRRPCKKCY